MIQVTLIGSWSSSSDANGQCGARLIIWLARLCMASWSKHAKRSSEVQSTRTTIPLASLRPKHHDEQIDQLHKNRQKREGRREMYVLYFSELESRITSKEVFAISDCTLSIIRTEITISQKNSSRHCSCGSICFAPGHLRMNSSYCYR